MFTLLDRETLRLRLPALTVADRSEPLRIFLGFDATAVDEMLERLTVLRARMLPAPTRKPAWPAAIAPRGGTTHYREH